MKTPNGYGSIVYLGKKRRRPYAIRKTVGWKLRDGKARQVYKYIDYFATKKEAMIALAKLNDKVIDVKKIDYTFDALYQEWYQKQIKGKSESKIKQLTYAYRHMESIHNTKIKDITEKMLQGIIDNMNNGYSSKHPVRQIMQGVMAYAKAKSIVAEDVSTMIDIGKSSKSTKHKAIPDKDLKKIKSIARSESIIFLTYTGMKITELITIEVENINIEERYIVGGIKSDAGRNRIIPIHKSQVEFIKKQLKGKKKHLFEYE